jgi:hypothetical protein
LTHNTGSGVGLAEEHGFALLFALKMENPPANLPASRKLSLSMTKTKVLFSFKIFRRN